MQIANLAGLPDSPENRSVIMSEMAALCSLRKQMVKQGSTANDVIKMFPKMLSYQGAMVRIFSTLLTNFPQQFVKLL